MTERGATGLERAASGESGSRGARAHRLDGVGSDAASCCPASAAPVVRAEHASRGRRRARGRSGARRAVQEVGHVAGRAGVETLWHPARAHRLPRGQARRGRWRHRGDRRARIVEGVRAMAQKAASRTTWCSSCSSATARSPAEIAKFNLPGPDMTAAGFRAAAEAADRSASSSRTRRARAARSSRRCRARARRSSRRRGPAARCSRRSSADPSSTRSPPKRPTPTTTAVSMLEAFDYAKRAVAASYEREGLHADRARAARRQRRQGRQPEPAADGPPRDGQSASVLALGSCGTATRCRPNEKLRALYAERRRSSAASNRSSC